MQGRGGENVHAADMEQRDGHQHLIVASEAVHMAAVDGIKEDGVLRQYCALRSPGGARGVAKQETVFEAGVSIRTRSFGGVVQQTLICGPVGFGVFIQRDKGHCWQIVDNALDQIVKGRSCKQYLRPGIGKHIDMFGRRLTPVERLEDGAKACTGKSDD